VQGTIKDYDAETRGGSLVTDDRMEVAIDMHSADPERMRSFRQGQRVIFEVTDDDGRPVARELRLVTFA
jgi:cold shock CspA family protein